MKNLHTFENFNDKKTNITLTETELNSYNYTTASDKLRTKGITINIPGGVVKFIYKNGKVIISNLKEVKALWAKLKQKGMIVYNKIKDAIEYMKEVADDTPIQEGLLNKLKDYGNFWLKLSPIIIGLVVVWLSHNGSIQIGDTVLEGRNDFLTFMVGLVIYTV